jgi:L-fucose isomerase-like protein
MVQELMAARKPTVLFAVPYSGHEWTGYGATMKAAGGELLDCMLTADKGQLAVAVRPFRAIHHLREAKIINVSAKAWPAEGMDALAKKFGTQFVTVDRARMLKAYDAVPLPAAEAEARWWTGHASAIVEPSADEIVRSCRLALAFEKLMDEEKATIITTDCYGTMYHQLPAFPCVGNVRLNNMGLGGICESDMRSAMTHIIYQGLTGKPGFISDPTMDESQHAIILAHCLGSMKMDGPEGEMAPYKLRSIMERQEGCVPQVKMHIGKPVTQAILVGSDLMPYFTGTIIDTPETERGCRTKITVRIDGDARRLWQNWGHSLHRVTCYGNIREDLERFCRFKGIKMADEAA